MTFCVNGEHLSLENAAELLALIILERIGGIWQTVFEAMEDFLYGIRPGCRTEFQGLAVSRDYYKG
jgi:hypothetical protein